MKQNRSFRFNNAIVRAPSTSVTQGLRNDPNKTPEPELFRKQHEIYVTEIKRAGARIVQLPPVESFPDSVFVEDTAICFENTAIVLRPGAPSRFGEAELIEPTLEEHFAHVLNIEGSGHIDGGDVLLSDDHAYIGLSARTNQSGLDALAVILKEHDYTPVQVKIPDDILHFKTECGLLDSSTIFATGKLAALDCFPGYQIIEVPMGEEAAANIVRYNDVVFISAGFPLSLALLRDAGYQVIPIDTSEPAKIDGGLSCMSLRF